MPAMSIHQKYLRRSATGQRCVKFSAEGRSYDGSPAIWGGPKMLRECIRNSECHRGKEKSCIEGMVAASPKVIDLEMGLPAGEGRKTTLRMDIVTLEPATDYIRLVFWEGKMIGDGRLRSRVHNPRVFDQLHAYRLYLQDSARDIVEAYREGCRIICHLHGMASQLTTMSRLDPLILAAAEPRSILDVDIQPRLVVFDDGKTRSKDAWEEHLGVLRKRLPVAVVGHGTETLSPLESIPRGGG